MRYHMYLRFQISVVTLQLLYYCACAFVRVLTSEIFYHSVTLHRTYYLFYLCMQNPHSAFSIPTPFARSVFRLLCFYSFFKIFYAIYKHVLLIYTSLVLYAHHTHRCIQWADILFSRLYLFPTIAHHCRYPSSSTTFRTEMGFAIFTTSSLALVCRLRNTARCPAGGNCDLLNLQWRSTKRLIVRWYYDADPCDIRYGAQRSINQI